VESQAQPSSKPKEAPLTLVQRMGYSMGSLFKIMLYSPNPEQGGQLAEKALALIQAQDDLLSDWKNNSELMRVLPQAWPHPSPISNPLYEALIEALHYNQISQQAFDISVGPLLSLWGFRGGGFSIPSPKALEQTLKAVGSDKIKLYSDPPRLQLLAPGMKLDFGGIGKGRALDLAGAYLRQQGIQSAALSCDSSSLFIGAPPNSPRGWPVGIKAPDQSEAILKGLWLQDQALSSSGDNQQFFEKEGIRYSHILDPRSGWPAPYRGSMTVLAASAAQADALSTALLILKPEEGKLLAQQEQIQAFRVWGFEANWQIEIINAQSLPQSNTAPVFQGHL